MTKGICASRSQLIDDAPGSLPRDVDRLGENLPVCIDTVQGPHLDAERDPLVDGSDLGNFVTSRVHVI